MVMIHTLSRAPLASSSRIVDKLGDKFVIKFGCPKGVSGEQNRVEARHWKRLKDYPNIGNILVPVLDASPDGSWLIMPKVKVPGRIPEADARALQSACKRLGIMSKDISGSNIGMLEDGTYVAVDYGEWNEYDKETPGSCDGTCIFGQRKGICRLEKK